MWVATNSIDSCVICLNELYQIVVKNAHNKFPQLGQRITSSNTLFCMEWTSKFCEIYLINVANVPVDICWWDLNGLQPTLQLKLWHWVSHERCDYPTPEATLHFTHSRTFQTVCFLGNFIILSFFFLIIKEQVRAAAQPQTRSNSVSQRDQKWKRDAVGKTCVKSECFPTWLRE